MSPELAAIIALFVGILVALGIALPLARRRVPPPVLPPQLLESLKDLGALKSQVEAIAQVQASAQKAVADLQTRLVESSSSVKNDLLQAVRDTKESLEALKGDYAARKSQEEDLRKAVQGIEAVIVGGSTRGGAGENVLAEAFQKFPAGMLETDFKVEGKPVEYALVLPSQRRLPIDSKWTGTDLLEQLAQTSDAEERAKLAARIEQAALRKAAEVQKYLDPRFTTNLGVAAIPDAVFACCRGAHIDAYNRYRILLMPYSLTIPYVLALYNLYLQHGQSVEIDNLNNFLSQVETQMTFMEDIVQNRIARIHAMSGTSRDDLMTVMANLRIAVQQLRSLPQPTEETRSPKD